MTQPDVGDYNFITATPDTVEKPLVGLGFPAGPVIQSPTAFAMFCLGQYTRTITPLPLIFMGQDPAQARNQMADHFMKKGCEAMIFFDCDMLYPANVVDQLFARNVDIVAADYRRRAHPFQKIGWKLDGLPDDPESGLVERTAMGLGVMMIRRHVFEQVPRPWFARIYSGETEAHRGVMTEDYYFCLKAREMGFKVWCDLDVTKETMHIGEQPVPWVIPGHVEVPGPSPIMPQSTSEAA